MKHSSNLLAAAIAGIIAATLVLEATPSEASGPSADEIVAKTNHTSYYQENDGRADVTMTIIDRQQRTRVRKFTVLRRNDSGPTDAGQRFYVYFHAPADVAKTVFMVHKHIGRDDDRWLYLPALDLVKRVAASDKRTSFVGSDFVYEDVSGRGLKEDSHRLLKTTKNYYVMDNTPKKTAGVKFSHYIMHIHRRTYLPTKVEFFDKSGKLYRTMTVDAVKTIGGHPTVTKATMKDLSSGSKTVVTYNNVRYGVGLPGRIFTERYLRRAPVKYLH